LGLAVEQVPLGDLVWVDASIVHRSLGLTGDLSESYADGDGVTLVDIPRKQLNSFSGFSGLGFVSNLIA
jgi:hypothetical protein